MEIKSTNVLSDFEKDKLNVLMTEKSELRSIINSMQKGVFQSLFAFITVLLGIGSLYWDIIDIESPSIRASIFLLLSQIQIFIALLAISQFTIQTSTAGYIQAIEKEINCLFGEQLLMFELKAAPRFMARISSTHTISVVLLVLMLFGFFCYLIIASVFQMGHAWFGIILIGESLLVIILILKAMHDVKTVEKYISKLFSSKVKVGGKNTKE